MSTPAETPTQLKQAPAPSLTQTLHSDPKPEFHERDVSSLDQDLAGSQFKAGLGIDYFKIKGTDLVNGGTAEILSNASPLLNLEYALLWNDKTTFTIGAQIERYSLSPFSSTINYVSGSGAKTGFGIGVTHKISDRFQVGFAFNAAQEFFLKSESPTLLSVDQVVIYEPALSARYAVFTKKNAEIGIEGVFAYLLAASSNGYSINSGLMERAGIYFTNASYPEAEKGLTGGIFYQNENQDTSIFSKNYQDIQIMLSYFWRINF